jgi:hypothetical protein
VVNEDKLKGWYNAAPRPANKKSVVNEDKPTPAANDQEEATKADVPSGGGDSSGFVLD